MAQLIRVAAASLLGSLLGTAAQAQPQGHWCEARTRLWQATAADVSRIREVPVPQSFHDALTAPCAGLELRLGSLLDWHMDFGDADSAAAALATLETLFLGEEPALDRYRSSLLRAWPRAHVALLDAEPLLRGSDNQFVRTSERFDRSPAVQRMQPLLRTHGAHVRLAREYLRAADFFRSTSLLARAQLYLRTVLQTRDDVRMRALPPRAAMRLSLDRWRLNEIDDLEARFALLSAEIEQTSEHIEEAQSIIRRMDRSLARDNATVAGLPGGACNAEPIAAQHVSACSLRFDHPTRLVGYWRARGHLDLLLALRRAPPAQRMLMDSGGRDTVSLALQWLNERRELFIRERNPQPHLDEAMVGLYVRRAALRTAEAQSAGNVEAGAELRRQATADLNAARRLTPEGDHPGRYRRIAI